MLVVRLVWVWVGLVVGWFGFGCTSTVGVVVDLVWRRFVGGLLSGLLLDLCVCGRFLGLPCVCAVVCLSTYLFLVWLLVGGGWLRCVWL